MALLGKEQLLQRPSLPTEDVEVPEIGGTIRVRAWTGAEYDEFSRAIKGIELDGMFFAAMLAASAVDESGNRLFDTNGDIERIANTLSKTTLERAHAVIKRMNKLGKEGLEDAEKN